jgi:cell wall assembly regulator SMI1
MSDAQDNIADAWCRIEKVLEAHAPEVLATLAPGAFEDELKTLERSIGLNLPIDLRRSLQIHNGQNDPTRCLHFCGSETLLSAVEIGQTWHMLTDLAVSFDRQNNTYADTKNSLNGDWWRRTCVPFAGCEGDYFCVDTDPTAPVEKPGIVVHVHDGSIDSTSLMNYRDWLLYVLKALEAGSFDRNTYGYFRVRLPLP